MDGRTALPIFCLLILASSIPSSLATSQNSTIDSEGKYANPSLGISFQAPPGWTVEEPKKSQPDAPDVAIIAPYSSGFTASVSFNIEKANGTSLDDYVKTKEVQIASGNESKNIRFLSEQDGTVGGVAAKMSLMEENFTSQGNNNMIEFKQVTVLANDKFYTIIYANDKNNFDSELSDFNQILDSIKFADNGEASMLDYLSIGIVGIAIAGGMIIRQKNLRSRKSGPKT